MRIKSADLKNTSVNYLSFLDEAIVIDKKKAQSARVFRSLLAIVCSTITKFCELSKLPELSARKKTVNAFLVRFTEQSF